MNLRPLGKTGLQVSPLGFGAFKIGRNAGIKYPASYELPSPFEVSKLLNGVLDSGINVIDTAPAYGISEERIGTAIAHRRNEFVLSTKVGETFEDGISEYNYSSESVTASIERSLKRLKTDVLDLVFIHSNANDLLIQQQTDIVETLSKLKQSGRIKNIGFSGKTTEGATEALTWADCMMVEYNLNDASHEAVITTAAKQGVGVVIKKGLASGHLGPDEAIRFVLKNQTSAA